MLLDEKIEDLVTTEQNQRNNSKTKDNKVSLIQIKGCLRVLILGCLLFVNKIFPDNSLKASLLLSNAAVQILLSIILFCLVHVISHRLLQTLDNSSNKYLSIISFLSELVLIFFLVLIPIKLKGTMLYSNYIFWSLFNITHWMEARLKDSLFPSIYSFANKAYKEVKAVEYTQPSKLIISIIMVLAVSIVWTTTIQLFINAIRFITQKLMGIV